MEGSEGPFACKAELVSTAGFAQEQLAVLAGIPRGHSWAEGNGPQCRRLTPAMHRETPPQTPWFPVSQGPRFRCPGSSHIWCPCQHLGGRNSTQLQGQP